MKRITTIALGIVLFSLPAHAQLKVGGLQVVMPGGMIDMAEGACGSFTAVTRSILCVGSTAHNLQVSNNNSAFTDVLFNGYVGNVGIGAAAGSGRLTVTGIAATGTADIFNGTTTGHHVIRFQNTSGDLAVGIDDSTGNGFGPAGLVAYSGIIDVVANKPLYFATNNVLGMTLDANQNLVTTGRVITTGSAPTAASTGTGSGPTNTVDTGSGDEAGTITITAGTSPGSTGTMTVTFSTAKGAFGTNAPSCIAMLGNGTGTWNGRATVIAGTLSTTAAAFNWDNNAVNLTGTSTYKFHYHCWGK